MGKQQLYGLGQGLIEILPASTEQSGEVRLATVSETTTGTADNIAVTPVGLAAVAIAGAPDATEGTKGIAQLATNAEALAGTNDTKIMTPLKVAAVLQAGGSGVFSTLTVSGLSTLNGSALIKTAGTTLNLGSDNDAGAVNLGVGTVARAIGIGNSAAAHSVTLGSDNTSAATLIQGGTGSVTITTASTGDIIANSSDTLLLDSAGVLELNSSAGVISIGNDAVAQNINIGTGAAARTITLGNGTSTTAVTLNAGTAGVNVGTNAVAHTVTIGNVTGASTVAINSGTGGIALASTSTGDITLASSDTLLLDSAGVLELNSSAGIISIGNDAVARNINIGTGAAARTITLGNVSGATALVLNSGTGGVALNTTGAGDVVVTSADTVLIDAAGVLELNSSAGVIGIGNDAIAQNINIGTGAAARVITIGNVSGASQVVLNSGTAGVAINTTGAGDVIVNSADTVLIDSAGVLELNSSGAAISIGNDAVVAGINIGTGTSTRVIAIGNANLGTTVTLTTGSGAINIGTNAVAHTVTVGTTTGAGATVIQAGTGAIALNAAGLVAVDSVTDTQASPTAASTLNVRVGSVSFTGFTTAAAASQEFTITNSLVSTSSVVLVTACNEGSNDAQMTVTRVKRASGSFVVTVKNNGAAALNGNIGLHFWVLDN